MGSRKTNQPASRGFTIVELLIVIVVIGILATISILAYNGIQQRARNTQTLAAAQTYLKTFQLYVAQRGSYPAVGTDNYCLGQEPASCTASPYWYRSSALESELKTVVSVLPLPSNGPGTASTDDSNLGYIPARAPTDGPKLDGTNSAFLVYILEGDTPCTAGSVASGAWPDFSTTAPSGGRTYYVNGVSVCWIPLPKQ